MKPEQQRIAIAEACGWKPRHHAVGYYRDLHTPFIESLPDYCNDLNAMHEAVNYTFRDASIQLEYSRALIQVIKSNSPFGKMFFSDFDLANATAAQRARAFLETLMLWDNGSA